MTTDPSTNTSQQVSACVTLHDGVQMPMLGLGTYQVEPGPTTEQAVTWALEAGYRHIDTASLYGNEEGVGAAVRKSGLPREHVFITTKVWNKDVRADKVREAFDLSMQRLNVDQIDLYLLHWPVPGKFLEAWQVLEQLQAEGRVRSIGVSNFLVHQLQELLEHCRVRPTVNQVEWHPLLRQPELMAFCLEQNIQLEAWAPLMQGKFAECQPLLDIAAELDRTPAQVAIRFGLQHGVIMIPKSTKRHRIEENAAVFDFSLSPEQMARIDALNQDKRLGADPNNVKF